MTCSAETAHCEGCADVFDRRELLEGAQRTLCPECRGEESDTPEADDHAEEDDHQGEYVSECSVCGSQFEADIVGASTLCGPCFGAEEVHA